jgi:hypothetical protein
MCAFFFFLFFQILRSIIINSRRVMTKSESICPATNICFLPLHTITDSATSPYRAPRVKKTLKMSWTAPYTGATHTNQVIWCPQPENVDSARWLRRWNTKRKPSHFSWRSSIYFFVTHR